MNQPTFPAARNSSRPLLTLATRIAMPLLVVTANALGAASASAQELHAPDADAARRYEAAVHVLNAQRYFAAYGRFAALADEGHAPAALMALAMVNYPPSMSGAQLLATPAQLQHWSALVAREEHARGSLVAGYDGAE